MLKIAKALAENSDAIFADEPTCNLDNGSIEYITNTLKYYSGSVVVISHDRYFLDEIVNKIWEIENGKITEYWGNYTQYLEQKEQENRTHIRKYEQYVNEKQRLEKIVDEKLKQAQKVGKRKSQKNTENGGRLAHQKSTGSKEKALHKSAKVAEKRMEELEEISKPTKERQIHFKISSSLEMYNPVPIMSDNLNKKVSNKVIFENAKFKIPLGKKVAITGANGTGKTTLLKMILNKEEGIEISPKVQIGYFAQNGYKFEKEQNVLEFLRKASDYSISEIRSMIAMLGIKQNVITREMKTLSGGEVIKILLCKMLLLNILTKYCVFTSEDLLLVMRPYQIVATERILNKIEVSTNYKKMGTIEAGGYIWHTTGSGKTLTSFKTAQLASNLEYIDKVLFVVDRKDLDYQTMKEYDRFEKGAANGNRNTRILQKQLEDSNTRIIVTTIQKLSEFVKRNATHPAFQKHLVLIFDECHRSQFGDMHKLIVSNFKNYHLFGFTGTPIFAKNATNKSNPDFCTTEQAFGDGCYFTREY